MHSSGLPAPPAQEKNRRTGVDRWSEQECGYAAEFGRKVPQGAAASTEVKQRHTASCVSVQAAGCTQWCAPHSRRVSSTNSTKESCRLCPRPTARRTHTRTLIAPSIFWAAPMSSLVPLPYVATPRPCSAACEVDARGVAGKQAWGSAESGRLAPTWRRAAAFQADCHARAFPAAPSSRERATG